MNTSKPDNIDLMEEKLNQIELRLDTYEIRQNKMNERLRDLHLNTCHLLKISSRQENSLQDLHRANNNNVQTICHILEATKQTKQYKMHKTPIFNNFFATANDDSDTATNNHVDKCLFYLSP